MLHLKWIRDILTVFESHSIGVRTIFQLHSICILDEIHLEYARIVLNIFETDSYNSNDVRYKFSTFCAIQAQMWIELWQNCILIGSGWFLSITVTSQWTRWRLKPPASQLFAQPFVQVRIKENSKAPRDYPFWVESTVDRWFHLTKGQ